MDRRWHTDPDGARVVPGDVSRHLPNRPAPDEAWADRLTAWMAWFGPGRMVVTAVCVAVVALGGFWLVRAPAPPAEVRLPQAAASVPPPVTLPTATTVVPGADLRSAGEPLVTDAAVVHVAGAVRAPGIYHLTGSRRVHEAIELAGGATADADLDALNLAQRLFDGQRLWVPAIGEAPETAFVTPSVVSTPAGVDASVAAPAGPIDLNRATSSELDTLPGVGPSTAQAIVDDRERNGPFASVDELDRVPGIGPAKLASLRDLVTV